MMRWVVVLAMLMVAAAPVNVSGSWTFTVDMPKGRLVAPVWLTQSGDKVSGTQQRNEFTDALAGSLAGDALMLTTTFSRAGKDVTWTYRGVIKSATTMAGTLEMSNEPGRWLKWTAAKK
jgi:hypothetical protein